MIQVEAKLVGSVTASEMFVWRLYDPKDGQWAEIDPRTGVVRQQGAGQLSPEMVFVMNAISEWSDQDTRRRAGRFTGETFRKVLDWLQARSKKG